MKILFFGSSSYCLPVLETLVKRFQVVGVVTRPGSQPQTFALAHKIAVFTPQNKAELSTLKNSLKKLTADLAVVADYGLIIPAEIFTLPRYQTLNIHFSKLPRWRGPSPVQFTILFGEKNAWITVIKIDETMDTGDIISQKQVKIEENETSSTLYQKLFKIAAEELPDIITSFANNKLKPQKQNEKESTYTKLLSRSDGFIPFEILEEALKGKQPTETQLKLWPLSKLLPAQFLILNFKFLIERAICAFTPWPGVWTEIVMKQCNNETMIQGKKRLKILKAHLEENPKSEAQNPKLVLDMVQLEGKKPVSWRQFSEGYQIKV